MNLLQTERAFQRVQEKGKLVFGGKGMETKLCGLRLLPKGVGIWEHWPKLNDGVPGFGNISPEVRRSGRVREVIFECDLSEAKCPSVLDVLLACGLLLSCCLYLVLLHILTPLSSRSGELNLLLSTVHRRGSPEHDHASGALICIPGFWETCRAIRNL